MESNRLVTLSDADCRRDLIIECIRNAFRARSLGRRRFDITCINLLPQFRYMTFEAWAQSMHCREASPEQWERLKSYVVNYFLCPNATSMEEVEQWKLVVFGKKKTWRIFGYEIRKVEE